jgi:hypothetical protein
MSQTLSLAPHLTRRDFLKLTAATAAAATLATSLAGCAAALDYETQAVQTWETPLTISPVMNDRMREIVRYATLAASSHNSQPWKFALAADRIRVLPDPGRRLPVVDPEDRSLWISLGCALENLSLAARQAGYEPQVELFPSGADAIDVRLEPAAAAGGRTLFDAIPLRQNTRADYDGQPVPAADLAALDRMPLEEGVSLAVVTERGQVEALAEYVHAGDLAQYGDQAFIDELVAWLRFNEKEALSTLDGLYSPCSGNPSVPRWIGRMFVTRSGAEKQAGTDAGRLLNSSGLVVLTSGEEGKGAWVRTGRVYQRLALTLTALGIKCAFMNQPIEVADLRPQLQTYLGMGTAMPQLLLRFGHADPLPRSLRRLVEEVLV